MNAFFKMSEAKRVALYEMTYESQILAGSEFLADCEKYASFMKAYLPSSCYTNFRDALFHFYKMTKSTEEVEVYSQWISISEHISRAKTDAMMAIADELQLILCGLKKQCKLSKYVGDKLKEFIDILCDYQNRLRLNGMMINDMGVLSITEQDFLESINVIFNFLSERLSKNYKKVIGGFRKNLTEKRCVKPINTHKRYTRHMDYIKRYGHMG